MSLLRYLRLVMTIPEAEKALSDDAEVGGVSNQDLATPGLLFFWSFLAKVIITTDFF